MAKNAKKPQSPRLGRITKARIDAFNRFADDVLASIEHQTQMIADYASIYKFSKTLTRQRLKAYKEAKIALNKLRVFINSKHL